MAAPCQFCSVWNPQALLLMESVYQLHILLWRMHFLRARNVHIQVLLRYFFQTKMFLTSWLFNLNVMLYFLFFLFCLYVTMLTIFFFYIFISWIASNFPSTLYEKNLVVSVQHYIILIFCMSSNAVKWCYGVAVLW